MSEGFCDFGRTRRLVTGPLRRALHLRDNGCCFPGCDMLRFVSSGTAGVSPRVMGVGPVPATKKALKVAGWTAAQLDLVELNEAFAAQSLACIRDLELDGAKVNVNGGAIALGHPIAATGSMLIGTVLDELERTDGRYGLVTMCAAGGMAPAIIIERI